jgi:ATP-binding cassette subfamily B protein RaxB
VQVLLSLVLEVLAIASPFFLQIVVDRVVVGRDRDLLAVLGIGFALLAVTIAVITALRSWLGVYISTRLNLQLLDTLFARLLRLPLAWFEKRHIGDIVSRFRSVDAIQRTLSLTFLETVMDGVMVVVTFAVMLWYSGTLTIIVVLAALAYGTLRWAMYGPQRRATDERIVHEAKAATHFIETLRGMMAIKLNLREAERRAAYLNHVVDQTNADVRVQNLALLQRAGNVLIFGLENVLVIWLGAYAVLEGQLSVGMLFAFLLFKLLFISRVNNLVDKTIEFRMLDLHADRVADIASRRPKAWERRLPSRGRTRRVGRSDSRGVTSDSPTASRASFSAACHSVRGRAKRSRSSGRQVAEKQHWSRSWPACSIAPRHLAAAGRDIRDWDKAAYRGRIGVVMQDDHLFVGTIEDNISFFDPQHDPDRVRDCARLAMIDADIGAMPMGYNTIVGSLGVALSGGQRSRVLLARALYRRPQILFLDETFDQLDLARERAITDGLRTTGIGLVIVSHRPETVGAVDRIVRLGAEPT